VDFVVYCDCENFTMNENIILEIKLNMCLSLSLISGMEWWNGQIAKLHLSENFYISQDIPAMAYLCL